MDPTLAHLQMFRLFAVSIGIAVIGVIAPFLGSWLLARQVRYSQQSLERIEASAERIALMVRELHNR